MDSSHSKEGLNDRYSTVLRYTDEQVGEVYNYLKKNRNNTIFIMLGDHGARVVHTYQDENSVKNATIDPQCQGKAFGNDELFTTTGFINYMGDDVQIQAMFEENKGKVYTGPTD